MNFKENASIMTDEEIVAAINIFYEEQQRRKRVKRQKLIDNFYSAFSELREAGITPKYFELGEDYSPVSIEEWDGFEFA